MRHRTYRYIDADSTSGSLADRRNPAREPRSGSDELVAQVTARVRSTWSSRSTIAAAIRERNVRCFLASVARGARARELAEAEGLSVRQTQRAIRAGREAVAEASSKLDRGELRRLLE